MTDREKGGRALWHGGEYSPGDSTCPAFVRHAAPTRPPLTHGIGRVAIPLKHLVDWRQGEW
jgi:hypothetical protein